MQPIAHKPISYREDQTIPPFDEDRTLLVMDGTCALCSNAARRIANLDKDDCIRITTSQSPLGSALLEHYGLRPEDPESWLLIENGRAYGSLGAILRLGPRLHSLFHMFAPLRILPSGVQNWLYARIARNRYRLFGKGDICAIPDERLKRRLVQ